MVERPDEAEAPAYFFTYINQVAGDDPVGTTQTQLDEALALFAGISEEASLRRYAPEKWSIRQVLNHVTDTERAFAFRVLWFARGFETPLPGYDQDIAATAAEADSISWASHVEEFRRVRLSTISLFRNLPAVKHGCAAASPARSSSRVALWLTSFPDTWRIIWQFCANDI